ncbi:hypothetical protein IWW38_005244, partial [Coemansia aciculifera]
TKAAAPPQPPFQGPAPVQAQHSHTTPVFYHVHQASGPPPPSRYYADRFYAESHNSNSSAGNGSASMACLSPPPSSTGEHWSSRPHMTLLERPIKGKRKRANAQQLEVLNKVFASTSFPSTEVRNRLARELGMTPRTVQIWFQNRRQASRQRDGHHSRNTKSLAVPDSYLEDAFSHSRPH